MEGLPLNIPEHQIQTNGKQFMASLRQLLPSEHHDKLYLVGGAVRNNLLGELIQDADLVTHLTASELKSLGFRLVSGKSTGPIFFKSDKTLGKIEVTLLRKGQTL